ncbi:hypothetical protein UNPF46_08575 [Bradyrhizobium sp. UNPF46]|uniref:hypothetical protein n=1 Tax=Bradyrhizobium sp. UNPF46 TaxID=1141168 RepID=UPI00114F0F70|nr:hypothetical protein [Bradyrhizobium sp. UNPF46]TQF41165.1 hypothetical protein UNPF46_08575 [Bradyrhizobium sp. UNPF46]
MQFNDTTSKSGLIQEYEFWIGVPDGAISGNTTLLKMVTRLMNVRYAKVLARLQLLTGKDGAEDTNYSSQQFSYFDIASGTGNYQFLTDQAGNTITDITGVLILPSSTSTEYTSLKKLTLDIVDAQLIMSPNPSRVGIPSGFIEKNNTVFFDYVPNYSASNGGKLFYRLVPSYFTSSDTTKAPGFTEAYHRILAMGAAFDWLSVNKPNDTSTLANISGQLTQDMRDLERFTVMKNPTRKRLTGLQRRAI